MCGSQQPYLISQDLSNPFWSKVVEMQEKKKRSCPKIKSRTRVFVMKRRASLERQRRRSRSMSMGAAAAGSSGNGIGRKVRILKKLIPNGESKEIDTLFIEAADYILALQMRIKAMQIMVNALSDDSNDHDDQ